MSLFPFINPKTIFCKCGLCFESPVLSDCKYINPDPKSLSSLLHNHINDGLKMFVQGFNGLLGCHLEIEGFPNAHYQYSNVLPTLMNNT